jgi:hypothetical protein
VVPRFAFLVPIVVMVLGSTVLLARPPAVAQEATPSALAAMANHPVTGTWQLVNKAADSSVYPSVAVFHADGTYLEVLPWGSPLLGVWQPTGERTAEVTQVVNYLADDRLVQGHGRAALEVDATGQTMTWHGVFVGRFPNGQIESVDEVFSIGTRLEAEQMVPLQTLQATPIPFPAATPEP